MLRMNLSGSSRSIALIMTLMMSLCTLAGCTEVLVPTVDPRASFFAQQDLVQEGEMITFDGRESVPVEGVITAFKWDFGDGNSAETIIGFTSHRYESAGEYTVTLTVENDQGGDDSTSVFVRVNALPVLELKYPANVSSGDTVQLDASNSYDPEGADLAFSWDLNIYSDFDGDGGMDNDDQETEEIVYIPTNKSGVITGKLTISDYDGASVSEIFTINVTTRKFQVDWVETTVEFEWDGYLEQGERWGANITPGEGGRIIAYEAILELAQDPVAPQDNFTVFVEVRDDGYNKKADTEAGNITQNEQTRAEMMDEGLNPIGISEIMEADSAEELLNSLLNQPGARFGQGEWIWGVIAQQADPDPVIDGIPDPDPGNDWELTVRITILQPRLVEIAWE